MATSGVDLSVSGLASGFDWKTVVSQLADVSRAPEKTLQADQAKIQQRNSAYKNLNTELSALSDKIAALKDSTLYGKLLAQSSDSMAATATAATGSAPGVYSFAITQLAKAAVQQGTTNVAAPLSATSDVSSVVVATAGLSTPITAGTFSVNGQQVTVASTDTLQAVFDNISKATSGAVTASYDPSADKITLLSASNIVLGSATDTSSFLQAVKLTVNGATSISSSAALGGIKKTGSLTNANFATPITGDTSGNGQFSINNVTIDYSTGDSLSDVLGRINNSTAGVSASFDAGKGQFSITSKSTGDLGVSLADVTGNFLTATGLLGGSLQRGQNLLYSINGGGQLSSQSNTITEASSGIAGLSVTALKESTVTITTSSDSSGVNTAINDFVTQFNKVQSLVDTYTASATDSTGKVTAGILTGEGDATDIASTLRRLAYNPIANHATAIGSLDDLGITTSGNDNKLTVTDSQKLADTLANNLNGVQDLFANSTTGLTVKLTDYMTRTIGDSGSLVAKQSTLTKQASDIDTQVATLERRVLAESASMTAEFVAMETAQQSLKTQLSYLQQNLGLATTSSSKTG